MRSRAAHGIIACSLFLLIAQVFGWAAAQEIDEARIVVWASIGVGFYIVLSYCFGFDPYRAPKHDDLAPWLRHIDRWELRSGQATLSMLGCLAGTAHWIDATYFVTAVVSGTVAAYMYFTTRLCFGAYSR